MIVRTFENTLDLRKQGSQVVVATDSEEIGEVCQRYSIPWEMTRKDHYSGTDRCREVAQKYPHPYILNLQGDEPLVNINDVTLLMRQFSQLPNPEMATLAYRSIKRDDFSNPNVVKVVKDQRDFALYFSRSALPYYRDDSQPFYFWHHIGVYAFTRSTLNQFCQWPASHLESCEKLEQLRALENKCSILLCPASQPSLGIDTPEDVEKYLEILP